MELLIARRLQTTTHDPEGVAGLRQTMGHIIVLNDKNESIYETTCIERPFVKKLPTVSRLPAGEYKFKIINKTPECPFAFIRIVGTGFDIKKVDDYLDSHKKIIVGKELLLNNTHYNLDHQREVLTKICKLLPEEGKITIRDEFKRDISTEIPTQESTEYES